jgi:sugar lactone lactonase YvrE
MWNKSRIFLLCLLCAWVCLAQTNPPAYMVQTMAGSAPAGDGGPATNAVLRFPNAVAFDASGNLYIADRGNSSIRTVNAAGIIGTFAGIGISGFSGDGGPANQAQLGGTLSGLAFDSAGNLYISDSSNHCVRKVTSDGNINTVIAAGNLPGTPSAPFWPNGLAFDGKGNLYIADGHNSQVYTMTPDGTVTVFAGTGTSGDSGDGGPAASAALTTPFGIFADSSGAVYVADIGASRVRKIWRDRTIHAFAGTGTAGMSGDGGPAVQAQLGQPMHLAGDAAGNLYITDYSPANRNIRMVAQDGTISTFAGAPNPNGLMEGDGGPVGLAMIQQAGGIAISPAGNIYFSDSDSVVRMVSNRTVSTAVGYRHFVGNLDSTTICSGRRDNRNCQQYPGNSAMLALFSNPAGIATDNLGNFFVADTNNFRIRKINATGMISTIAGTGQCGSTNDGGTATSAAMTRPLSLAVDAAQNIYVGYNGSVRQITLGGLITTIAGGGSTLGDGGPATSANLTDVNGIAVDSAGNIYLADTEHNLIRKVTPNGLITTLAGTGVAGNDGDGGLAIAAQLNGPTNLALDSAGNLYVADTGNSRVRMIKPDGAIAAFAGTGTAGASGDGGPAISAQLGLPVGIAVDAAGAVYIGDAAGLVRVVTRHGVIHTIAGIGSDLSNAGFSGDGATALNAAFNSPGSLVLDTTGNLYVLDRQNERVRMLTPMSH